MKVWLIFILGIITAIVLGILGIFLIAQYLPEDMQGGAVANASLNVEIAVPTPSNCTNLDLILTSECLQKEVSTYFNYSIRDDLDRSLENIKQFGGDCFDYNNLYVKWLKELGFNAELIQFDLNNETSHVLALGYTHNSYCILDQTVHPSCVILGEEAKLKDYAI